jgi:hypothetical protein
VKRAVATVVLALAGCLSVPENGQEPMCESNSDCDEANGEICAQGVCWGDPPEGNYAARLASPLEIEGLAPTEITKVDIGANGWFTTSLRLEAPVTVSGVATAECGGKEPCRGVAATVTISRPSRIPGGPAFSTSTTTDPASGAFSLEVPRAEADEDYVLVVKPDRSDPLLDALPPARLIVRPTDDVTDIDVPLGHGRTIRGAVQDETGYALANARVVVRGRWEETANEIDISSVATTDGDGVFTVYLPASTIDVAGNLRITPPDSESAVLPTLIVPLDLSTGGVQVLELGAFAMPYLGNTRNITIPISGTTGDGMVEPVSGADVRLLAELDIPRLPADPIRARVEARGTTLFDGTVELRVLNSPMLEYEIQVKPPAGSGLAFATVYGEPFELVSGNLQTEMHLAQQVPVHGRVYDHKGRPAAGMVVSVVPNASYAATLSEDLQRKLGEVVTVSEPSDDDGQFAVYVDPVVAGGDVQYDVLFEAPLSSLLPSWQKQALSIDRVNGIDLGDFDLPPAAYVRSPVTGPDDEPIDGAEVRLYDIPADLLPCLEGRPGPGPDDPACAQKAILRARAEAVDGEVHLVIADPGP